MGTPTRRGKRKENQDREKANENMGIRDEEPKLPRRKATCMKENDHRTSACTRERPHT